MNQFSRNLALWLVLGLMVVLLFNIFQGQQPRDEELSYSQLVAAIEAGRVDEAGGRGARRALVLAWRDPVLPAMLASFDRALVLSLAAATPNARISIYNAAPTRAPRRA